MWVEDKDQDKEIFCTLTELKKEDQVVGNVESHICWMKTTYKNCGQLIAYAFNLHHSQFFVFSFTIYLYGWLHLSTALVEL